MKRTAATASILMEWQVSSEQLRRTDRTSGMITFAAHAWIARIRSSGKILKGSVPTCFEGVSCPATRVGPNLGKTRPHKKANKPRVLKTRPCKNGKKLAVKMSPYMKVVDGGTLAMG